MAESKARRASRQRYLASEKGQATRRRRERAYQAAHPEIYRTDARRFARTLRRHGMTPEDWTAMFNAQSGCCYLCGCDLVVGAPNGDLSQPHVDHVHDHCGPKKSCPACRRGIACARCNALIGWAEDDPALLVRIAETLTLANAAATVRIAAVPVQDRLF